MNEQALVLTLLGMTVVAAVLGVNYLTILIVSLFGKERNKPVLRHVADTTDESGVDGILPEFSEEKNVVAEVSETQTNADSLAQVMVDRAVDPKITVAIFAAIEAYESENSLI